MKIKRQVWVNNSNGQKLVTIPSLSNIQGGDWVWIDKVSSKGIPKPKEKTE